MSYRNITVNGNQYQYVVGKTHTKVKEVGVFVNKEIGHKVARRCECCNASFAELHPDTWENDATIAVTPSEVERAIVAELQKLHYKS